MSKTERNPVSDCADPPSADALIRAVMSAQKRERSRQTFPELEPAAPVPTPQKAPNRQKKQAPEANFPDRIKSWRPAPWHMAWAALALVVYLRPWLIPGVLFVTFWVVLIAYLTLGPARAIEILRSAWAWLSRTRPRSAEKLHRAADALALKFDALRDRLPERWAEKLALPDLTQATAVADSAQDEPDPFDRLAKLPDVYRG